MESHADLIDVLRARRTDLLRGLRELGLTEILVPASDDVRTLRLVASADAHVDVADLYAAEELVSRVAGEPVELVITGTGLALRLSTDAVEL
ncbi:hypothetical protein [Microbacterium sp. NPDC058389]|uniref:hypothetical protein n=1 Tax=Microbacterium sp. NPDC058389 TaxID=3346475 RepID=UPI00365D3FD8